MDLFFQPARSRGRDWKRALLLLLALFPLGVLRAAGPSEYQVKAAFIYNFAKFVEWPASNFPSAASPMVLAVVGDEAMKNDISAISGRLVGTHPIQVQWFPISRADQLLRAVPACQILYILPSESAEAGVMVHLLGTNNILTICDGARDFVRVGAAINFIKTPDEKIRFEINVDAVKRAGLKIQSPLLNLARIVRAP